jgi:hypothetical protein
MMGTFRHGRWSSHAGCALGALCLAALTACTNKADPSTEGSPAASHTAAAPNNAVGSPAADAPWTGTQAPPDALAAYDAMWEDIMSVSRTSDYKNPRIAMHMIGQPLNSWTLNVSRDRSRGWVGRGRLTWHPRVTSVTPTESPTRVEVADCLDSTRWVNVTADGKPTDDTPGGRHRSASAITKTAGGSWRVSEQLIGDAGTC